LFCYSLRSVMDFPLQIIHCLAFLAVESRERGLSTSRHVHSSQESVEQVLVLSVGPVVVTDLFCHCLRSVVEFPPLLFWRLRICCSGITGERPWC